MSKPIEDEVIAFTPAGNHATLSCKHCGVAKLVKFPMGLKDLPELINSFQIDHSIEKCAGKLKAHDPITLYAENDFMGNIYRVEGKYCTFGFQSYAQYPAIPFCILIPRGKRNARKYMKVENEPFILILKGYGHPDPGDGMVDHESTIFPGAKESKYVAFDERYIDDFKTVIEKHIKATGTTVLLSCGLEAKQDAI